MDGARFDAWTRRRFGAIAGELAGSLLILAGPDDTAANKNHKKKKKCKQLGQPCQPGGKRKCCHHNLCFAPDVMVHAEGHTIGPRCCKDIGKPCTMSTDCCSEFCLDDVCEPEFCKELGQVCGVGGDCCSESCEDVCCRGIGFPCTSSDQCCSGNCDATVDLCELLDPP